MVPGHRVPPGSDPATQASVVEWIASFGVADYVESGYGQMLIDEGYASLYGLEFTVEDFVTMIDGEGNNPPVGAARRIVRGATEVMSRLGVFQRVPAAAGVVAVAPAAAAGGADVQGLVAIKDRGSPPVFPQTVSTGVAGLATRASMSMWAAELILWAGTWSDELGAALGSLRSNPTQSVTTLEAGLSRPRDNVLLASD